MDLRDKLFSEIYYAAKDSNDIVILTADTDSFYLKKFKEDFPDRIYNTGVSEQNTILLATGLALEGKTVFVFSIIPFITMRCFEQIKFNIDILNLHIIIIGLGSGYSFAYDGPTHYGINDIGIMRALKNFSIFNPGDEFSTFISINSSIEINGPSYIRLDKGQYPHLGSFCKEIRLLRASENQILIVSSGTILHQIKKNPGLKKCGLIDVLQLKPFDKNLFVSFLEGINKFIIIEEHIKIGGLFSIISELNLGIEIEYHGIESEEFEVGDREWLIKNNILKSL